MTKTLNFKLFLFLMLVTKSVLLYFKKNFCSCCNLFLLDYGFCAIVAYDHKYN
jgi:hypothetical protein